MRVHALIPAYNEEKSIGTILNLLIEIDKINCIVVVDDGSTDQTADIAASYPVELIQNRKNLGKGAAIQRGLEYIDTDILLLLDGDLIGLREKHVYRLINPVINNEADMVVGIFDEGRGLTDLAQLISPRLSGQRAIKFEMIKDIQNLSDSGFGVEISINRFIKKRGRIMFVKLPALTHILKEEKRGIIRGVLARINMYWEVLLSLIKD